MNKEFFKKNASLVIGISIPILMIIFVVTSIYLPGLFVKPQYDFLYVSGDDRYSYDSYRYSVEDGALVENQVSEKTIYNSYRKAKLYIYDAAKNESREISFEAARQLNLDPVKKSPDGFAVVYGSRSSGSLFYSSRDYDTHYLVSGNASKKINLQLPASSGYYENFRFIGWIIK